MKPYPLRRLIQSIFRVVLRILTQIEATGLENLPKGGYIIATNHLSVVDPVLVFSLLNRSDVTALVAKKHRKNPFFRWIINAAGGIWLNRDEADSRAVRAARDHLQNGGVLGISPEGTRSPTKALQAGKTGVAFLADLAGVPIVPVAIIGTEQIASELRSWRRPRLQIRFGEPFRLPPLPRRQRDEALQQNTDEIMSRIAALLPPNYRGVYAEHPRLRSLMNIPSDTGF
jgi:1-acyl-sn-glycerol-3-phosphate acyltransferase